MESRYTRQRTVRTLQECQRSRASMSYPIAIRLQCRLCQTNLAIKTNDATILTVVSRRQLGCIPVVEFYMEITPIPYCARRSFSPSLSALRLGNFFCWQTSKGLQPPSLFYSIHSETAAQLIFTSLFIYLERTGLPLILLYLEVNQSSDTQTASRAHTPTPTHHYSLLKQYSTTLLLLFPPSSLYRCLCRLSSFLSSFFITI